MKRTVSILAAATLLLLPPFLGSAARSPEKPAANWFRPPLGRVEYLVLTGQDLVEAWAPLVEWKRQTGLAAHVVAVEDVLSNPLYRGADEPETIRNFLKDLYWKWGLSWVLLGGDVNVVPTRFINIF